MAIVQLAFRAVDALATMLPPQQVFPPLHELVTSYMQNPDPGLRKAAMMAFGVTVEGCSEFIRPHMKSLWPLLDAGFTDGEPIVRKAACIAFACVCEWLEEECVERHAVLLPVRWLT
jgi:importin-4